MNASVAIARIKAILAATDRTTDFKRVFAGEPLGLPLSGPYAAFWLTGESRKGKTLGNVMVRTNVRVRLYWELVGEDTVREAVEQEIWTAMREVQAAFRADSLLNATSDAAIADLEIGNADAGYMEQSSPTGVNAWYRTLTFDLEIEDLEAEAIAS